MERVIQESPEVNRLSESISAKATKIEGKMVTVRITSPFGDFDLQVPIDAGDRRDHLEQARLKLYHFALALHLVADGPLTLSKE